MASDHERLAAWRAGDNRAGDALVQDNFDRVYRFFASKVDTGADDLVQRTFELALHHAERLRSDVSFGAFLLGVARNVLLQARRRVGRRAARIDPLTTSAVDLGASPSVALAGRREQRVLNAALRSLPLDLQALLELYYWEELPVGELTVVFEVPAGTIKSRLYRARKELREALRAVSEDAAAIETTMQGLEQWAADMRAQWRRPER